MVYWDKALNLGWSESGGLLQNYNPAIAFDPEFLAFNNDGTELLLNLQQNSALARISTSTGELLSISGYGLKQMTEGADIVDDGECRLVTNDCLYFQRTPDGIATVEYEGVDYVFTADEGSDFDLDDYVRWNECFHKMTYMYLSKLTDRFHLPSLLAGREVQ